MLYNWDNLELEYLDSNILFKMMLAEKNKDAKLAPTLEEILKMIKENKWKLKHKEVDF